LKLSFLPFSKSDWAEYFFILFKVSEFYLSPDFVRGARNEVHEILLILRPATHYLRWLVR
jgi:hypothetical protein